MNNPYISTDYARGKNLHIFEKYDLIDTSEGIHICEEIKFNSLEFTQNMINSTV